jgi:peptide/nickel transport system permease protein
VLVLWGVATVVFFLFNLQPGDPARMVAGQRADEKSLAAIRKDLGLDQPLYKRYLFYLNDLSPLSINELKNTESGIFLKAESYITLLPIGSKALILKAPYLRRSFQSRRPVCNIIAGAMPATAALALAAIVFATVVGIFLGIVSALYKDKWPDRLILILASLGTAGPSFFVGIIVAWLFGFVLSSYTGLDATGNLYSIDPFRGEYLDLRNIILPALTLGIRPLAIITQLARNAMLETLSMDYIRTAHAKGLAFSKVLWTHALQNSLNPLVTAISGWFAGMMAGAVFIEYIFGWRGIGNEMVEALSKYDLPVVMGAVLVIASVFVIVNLLVDIIYGLIDPRIRVK